MAGNKPVIAVIGASGNIGKATIQALSTNYADKFEIKAGVRNVEKATDLAKLPGVTVFQAAMGDEKLKESLKGIGALFIVTPGAENRAPLTIATAEAAKEAGVKFILVLSVPVAELSDKVFGRQLGEVEQKISKMGIPHCFIRLPLFTDNLWAFKDTIQGQSTIYSPVNPQKPFTSVAVQDAGKACAVILADYTKHTNTTYTITSDRYTYDDVTKEFSSALGREIKYVQVPTSVAKESFMKLGFPEWQTDGIIELFEMINADAPETNYKDLTSFNTITGEEPTSTKQWINAVAGAFK